MHFRPAELNVLLREIPAKPSARRLFFTVVVACRRRLRKSWQQTPLAKLFTLEDEWSLLKLRAQVTRTREAIRKRGLLLHDAFLKFDYSRTGMLSLPEVYGAFEWLRIPVTPEEVLFFVRSVSADDHVSYADFMELLCPPAEEEEGWQDLFAAEADEGGDEAAAPPGGGAPVAVKRQLSRVTPKGGGELVRLAQQRDREEAEVEAEFRRQLRLIEDARAERDKEMVVSSDFSWLRKTRLEGKPPFLVTRHACFYDCTRGREGEERGLPTGLESRGKARYARQGEARQGARRVSRARLLDRRLGLLVQAAGGRRRGAAVRAGGARRRRAALRARLLWRRGGAAAPARRVVLRLRLGGPQPGRDAHLHRRAARRDGQGGAAVARRPARVQAPASPLLGQGGRLQPRRIRVRALGRRALARA
ncbi:hypothetical protein EMIHUDRAFT_446781 [Emiliania huxleyi CCMP1516]|uniref:EF-hand domain-containing protein n=2 Tax=Emiliania huxleyi TaxID=2903 RepID=A0A0D3KWY2_EMIH1|nr:hypothetical protein EMIHUDRAFT_446781 [Emiliania huxleyi CCMP1516]EOD40267.1 hypothetical protein EMIHUDRAFT_446781 [Emiliania huxleyi CCMP1516]|eukprot:XP_005792696.1 hypothetical protein EMIHUDRAFT_446781 [Emiliania huxleyi CCMP1516]